MEKHVHLIGTGGLDDWLVQEREAGRASWVRGYSGTLLIHELLKAARAGSDPSDDPPRVSMAVQDHCTRSVRLAKRDAAHRVVHERDHSTLDRIAWPEMKKGKDGPASGLVIVHDAGGTVAERADHLVQMRSLPSDAWTIIHTDEAQRLVETAARSPGLNRRQTMAVMEADDLRDAGMAISKGSSWDRTFEDTLARIADGDSGPLAANDHVLIRFGAEAVVHAHRHPDGKVRVFAHFLPDVEEGAMPARTGPKAGIGVFLARLSIEMCRCALPREGEQAGEVRWVNDARSTEDRIPFAAMQAMRSVLRAGSVGWIEGKDGLTLDARIFALNKDTEDAIASVEITDLTSHPSLLHLATHAHPGTIEAWAMNYIRTGERGLLGAAPFAFFGKLLTADREEVQQYRDIRNKMLGYTARPGKAPYTIGVFGRPGSGKTFGVEQVKDALGDSISWMTFNIGSFKSETELEKVWQQIRDENLRGRIPFVLFDEFDAMLHGVPYGWFQHFLQPANEGVFEQDARQHPLGKGIFIFTGGTCDTYTELRRTSLGGEPVIPADAALARQRKMPDMARRLQDHIDVKGISARTGEPPQLHLVRRAIVLRNQFKRALPKTEPKDAKEPTIAIDLGLLYALMRVPDYYHGTSAMTKLISGLTPDASGHYSRAALPADDVLDNFVEPALFRSLMNTNDHLHDVIEPLAHFIHDDWRSHRETAAGKEADVPWEELKEHYRDSNRMQAMDIKRKLDEMGYRIVKNDGTMPSKLTFTDEVVERMARMEHDRWMKEKLAAGWTYGPERNNLLRIHPLLVPYDQLGEKDKDMDRDPVRRIPELLGKVGFGVE